jgi:hypothetical protein
MKGQKGMQLRIVRRYGVRSMQVTVGEVWSKDGFGLVGDWVTSDGWPGGGSNSEGGTDPGLSEASEAG